MSVTGRKNLKKRPEERLVRAILGVSSKPKLEVPMNEGSLNVEKLIEYENEDDD